MSRHMYFIIRLSYGICFQSSNHLFLITVHFSVIVPEWNLSSNKHTYFIIPLAHDNFFLLQFISRVTSGWYLISNKQAYILHNSVIEWHLDEIREVISKHTYFIITLSRDNFFQFSYHLFQITVHIAVIVQQFLIFISSAIWMKFEICNHYLEWHLVQLYLKTL
jgi:hypothetical protein